jgi:GPH family glycoside/pentoside/hexuronide:cation symporter
MGKKNAFMLSQGISIIGYVLLWFLMVPGKPWMFMFALPFFSFGIGGLFTLMMSMTADVCDLDELATGKRREGIFGAIYWWMVKFGFAIAGLLSGAIMSLRRLHPGCRQPARGRGGRPAPVLFRRAHLRHAAGDVDHAQLRPRRKACRRGARRTGAAQAASGGSSQGSGGRPWLAEHGLLLPGAEPSPLAGNPPPRSAALQRAVPARPVRPVLQRLRQGPGAGDRLSTPQIAPAHRPASHRTPAGCARSPAPRAMSRSRAWPRPRG